MMRTNRVLILLFAMQCIGSVYGDKKDELFFKGENFCRIEEMGSYKLNSLMRERAHQKQVAFNKNDLKFNKKYSEEVICIGAKEKPLTKKHFNYQSRGETVSEEGGICFTNYCLGSIHKRRNVINSMPYGVSVSTKASKWKTIIGSKTEYDTYFDTHNRPEWEPIFAQKDWLARVDKLVSKGLLPRGQKYLASYNHLKSHSMALKGNSYLAFNSFQSKEELEQNMSEEAYGYFQQDGLFIMTPIPEVGVFGPLISVFAFSLWLRRRVGIRQ